MEVNIPEIHNHCLLTKNWCKKDFNDQERKGKKFKKLRVGDHAFLNKRIKFRKSEQAAKTMRIIKNVNETQIMEKYGTQDL